MASRTLVQILRRTAQVVVLVVLAGLVLFYGLTRTERGRDALRAQLEQQFDARFQGELQIDTLSGDLLQNLYARDVRLYDPDGRLVAQVDSAVLRPRWSRLAGRQLAFREVILFEPQVHAIRAADGTWNMADALEPVAPSGGRGTAFVATRVSIRGGRVSTHNEGAAPATVDERLVFDYANTVVRDVEAQLSVDWQPGDAVLDVFHVSAELDQPRFMLRDLNGQLLIDDDGVVLNQVALQTDSSRVHMRAEARLPNSASPDTTTQYALRVEDSRLDFDEWRRLFPRLPLHDAADVSVNAHGPLADLVIDELRLERGDSRLEATGTVAGLPRRADFDITFDDNRVDGRDLRALLPDIEGDVRHLGPMRVTLTAAGTVPLADEAGRTVVQGSLDVSGQPGGITSTYQVTGRRGQSYEYHSTLTARDLDVARVVRRRDIPSRLDGTVQVSGRLRGDGPPSTRLTAQLSRALVDRTDVGGSSIELDYDGSRVEGTLNIAQAEGALTASGSYDPSAGRAYEVDVETRSFDLGPLLGADSITTRLTGAAHARGRGPSWSELVGQLHLVIDSSSVAFGEKEEAFQPSVLNATLGRQVDGRRYLDVGGDVLEARLEGHLTPDAAAAMSALWARALGRTFNATFDKPYRPDTTAGDLRQDPTTPTDPAAYPRPSVAEPIDVTGSFQLLAPDLVSRLAPAWPSTVVPSSGRFRVYASADSLALTGRLNADSLSFQGTRWYGPRASLALRAGAPAHPEAAVDVRTDVTADSAFFAETHVPHPDIHFEFANGRAEGRGALTLDTRDSSEQSPLQLEAVLHALPNRNRLLFTNFQVNAQGATWQQPSPQHVDLYGDAVVIDSVMLESRPGSADVQQLILEGIASPAPADTLYVSARGIALGTVAPLSRLREPIGGILDGRLAYTGGIAQPELTGSVLIDGLTYDDRLLGTLEVRTHYLADTTDVALQASLRPTITDVGAVADTSRFRLEPSRLDVEGTLRFPTLQGGRIVDPGRLDLAVDAHDVDAFFFDYIFRNLLEGSSGSITGAVDVSGHFLRPVFDAELQLSGTQFEVPKYGLSFSAEGPATADAEGIHLNAVRISDPTGGTASFGGSLLFNDYRYFSLDLHGQLDEIQVMNMQSARDLPFYGHIWASGDLHLTGPLDDASLRSPNARTTSDSEVFIPIEQSDGISDTGFILFADSTGQLPDIEQLTRRVSVLERPEGERKFAEGLDMDLNIEAPSGSTVRLVIDPLVGESINAVGSGRVQLVRDEGEFSTFGTLTVEGGEYLFSAGELLFRRFQLDPGGTIEWDGSPIDPRLDLTAYYRTRASSAGLPESMAASTPSLVPVLVRLHVTERVTTPQVGLQLAIDRADRERLGSYEGLEAYLNQPDRAAEFATSVLLTNSFLLTTSLADQGSGQSLSDTRNQFAFSSLSQLVASQLNHYLSQAIPNFDLTLGLQGQSTQDLGVTYGVALRLLDERLIIRGEGIYQNEPTARTPQGLEGEFVVEVRLNPSVSVEVFYRREGDVLESNLTNTTGAGLSYETQFTTWPALLRRFFGWLLPGDESANSEPPEEEVAASAG